MERFNTIPTSGNWSDIAGTLDANFLRCYTALVQSESLVGLSGSNFQGIYTSASTLPDVSSSCWALVGSSLSALTLYVYNTGSSEWGELNSTTYNFTDFTALQTQLYQSSIRLEKLQRLVGDDMQTVDSDLDVADENGYTLARFTNGHIKTKNFDSSKALSVDSNIEGSKINESSITKEKMAFDVVGIGDDNDDDLNLTDEEGNNLAKFAEGHFKVKYFSTKIESHNALYDNSKIGCVPYQKVEKGAINHIIEYGQSLSVGGASVAITTSAIGSNCKMLGSSVWDLDSTVLNPLKNGESESSGESGDSEATSTGEDLIVPFTDVLGQMYGDEYKFLATSSGVSGTPIDWLSKQSSAGYSYYSTRFLQHIANAKNAAVALGENIVCPAIVFVQGESDYNSSKASSVWSDGANTAERIALYKARLITLKNNMQADIMNLYGQSKKPLFFVHMVGTSNQKKTGMPINMAMFEAAAENEDIILLGSPTFAPRDGVHPSGNGYRWTGEKYAEIVYTALRDGVRLEPVRPRRILVDEYNVVLYMQAPYLPLTINTWTCQSTDNYGFSIRINGSQSSASSGSDVTIKAVKVQGNVIVISTDTNLDKISNIEVRYSWNDNSCGNICDSDRWCPLFPYIDDSINSYTASGNLNYRPLDENGNNIFGERYPMMNWCVPFTYYLWNGVKFLNIK